MSIFGEDLAVVEFQPITLVPPSICQVRENQMIRQMNNIYIIRKERGVKIHKKEILPEPNTQEPERWWVSPQNTLFPSVAPSL